MTEHNTKYFCKYHVVFIPKFRKKAIYGKIRQYIVQKIVELAHQKGCRVETGIGGVMKDHVHMVISIPPKYSVASIIGYIKGKSAIAIARDFEGRQRNFTGQHFWARGYFVSTVGVDEETVKKYVVNQTREDIRRDSLEQ